jgi:hypothetical protein
MWKYNGKLGMIWTIVKMDVKDDITPIYMDDYAFENRDDDECDDIPNFEMDNDPDLID